MKIPNRRLGTFFIDEDLIGRHPRLVRKVMAQVIVLRAEYQFDRLGIEYTALSDKFEVVPERAAAPLYDLVFEKGPKGRVSFLSFERVP